MNRLCNKKILFAVLIVFLSIVIAVFLAFTRSFYRYDLIYRHIHLFFALIFVLWAYTINYRIADKKVKKLSNILVALLIFWMIAKFFKMNASAHTKMELYCWYCYYLPQLFIPIVYYKAINVNSFCKYKRIVEIVIILVSSILLGLVFTNERHNFCFIMPSGGYVKGGYAYGIGYHLIIIWMITLYLIIIIQLIRRRKYLMIGLISLTTLFLLIYNRFYIVNSNNIIMSDYTLITATLIACLFEASINLNVIPGNYPYSQLLKIDNLDLNIVDKKYNAVISSKNASVIPYSIYEDIHFKNNEDRVILKRHDNEYIINKIDGGYSIITHDVSTINALLDELSETNRKINEQNKILMLEENLNNIAAKQSIYNALTKKIDEALFEKLNLINQLTARITGDESKIKEDYHYLAYIKILVGYCKNKSALVLKGMDREYISGEEFSILVHTTFQDANTVGIFGQLFVDIEDDIKIKYVDIMYDFIEYLLEKCINLKNVSLFIRIIKQTHNYLMYVILDTESIIEEDYYKIDPIIELQLKEYDGSVSLTFEDNRVLYNLSVKGDQYG